jgi:anti-sigma factor RsiW
MNLETQLKLQAYVDGELTGREAADIATLLERDPAARELARELEQTARLLKDNEPQVTLPEAREFYWSKIAREIERVEAAAAATPARGPWGAWLWRLVAPACGVAALMIALAVFMPERPPNGSLVQTSQVMSGVFSFYSKTENMTVVWIDTGLNSEFTTPAADATLGVE